MPVPVCRERGERGLDSVGEGVPTPRLFLLLLRQLKHKNTKSRTSYDILVFGRRKPAEKCRLITQQDPSSSGDVKSKYRWLVAFLQVRVSLSKTTEELHHQINPKALN